MVFKGCTEIKNPRALLPSGATTPDAHVAQTWLNLLAPDVKWTRGERELPGGGCCSASSYEFDVGYVSQARNVCTSGQIPFVDRFCEINPNAVEPSSRNGTVDEGGRRFIGLGDARSQQLIDDRMSGSGDKYKFDISIVSADLFSNMRITFELSQMLTKKLPENGNLDLRFAGLDEQFSHAVRKTLSNGANYAGWIDAVMNVWAPADADFDGSLFDAEDAQIVGQLNTWKQRLETRLAQITDKQSPEAQEIQNAIKVVNMLIASWWIRKKDNASAQPYIAAVARPEASDTSPLAQFINHVHNQYGSPAAPTPSPDPTPAQAPAAASTKSRPRVGKAKAKTPTPAAAEPAGETEEARLARERADADRRAEEAARISREAAAEAERDAAAARERGAAAAREREAAAAREREAAPAACVPCIVSNSSNRERYAGGLPKDKTWCAPAEIAKRCK